MRRVAILLAAILSLVLSYSLAADPWFDPNCPRGFLMSTGANPECVPVPADYK